MTDASGFSIVVPVYNEEEILEGGIRGLVAALAERGHTRFEIVLSENGSTDGTPAIASALARTNDQISVVHLPEPNFGAAVRAGIRQARFPATFLLNADWLDVDFVVRALPLLQSYSIVVGSKLRARELDQRPLVRKFGSALLTLVLKGFFSFRGADSHGLKAFRTEDVLNLLPNCRGNDIIESEILLWAQRRNYSIIEIPVGIKEVRPPRVGFFRRCVRVARELVALYLNLRRTDG